MIRQWLGSRRAPSFHGRSRVRSSDGLEKARVEVGGPPALMIWLMRSLAFIGFECGDSVALLNATETLRGRQMANAHGIVYHSSGWACALRVPGGAEHRCRSVTLMPKLVGVPVTFDVVFSRCCHLSPRPSLQATRNGLLTTHPSSTLTRSVFAADVLHGVRPFVNAVTIVILPQRSSPAGRAAGASG